jgi:hypothetical protein
LSDLELSRNVMVYNGVLNHREISRITLYLKDWVMQVAFSRYELVERFKRASKEKDQQEPEGAAASA